MSHLHYYWLRRLLLIWFLFLKKKPIYFMTLKVTEYSIPLAMHMFENKWLKQQVAFSVFLWELFPRCCLSACLGLLSVILRTNWPCELTGCARHRLLADKVRANLFAPFRSATKIKFRGWVINNNDNNNDNASRKVCSSASCCRIQGSDGTTRVPSTHLIRASCCKL